MEHVFNYSDFPKNRGLISRKSLEIAMECAGKVGCCLATCAAEKQFTNRETLQLAMQMPRGKWT